MKDLAKKMMEYWGAGPVMDEAWIMEAISVYCYAHHIDLTEEEEIELFEILWD